MFCLQSHTATATALLTQVSIWAARFCQQKTFSSFMTLLVVLTVFTPQTLGAVGVLFSPMVSGWVGIQVGGGKKFVRTVPQKPKGVGS